MLEQIRKYVRVALWVLLALTAVVLSLCLIFAWRSSNREVYLILVGVLVLGALFLNVHVAKQTERLGRHLFKLTQLAGTIVLLAALIGFAMQVSKVERVALVAFEDQSKDGKYNGKALADSLQMELARIQKTLTVKVQNVESTERLIPIHKGQDSERFNESIKDLGTFGAGDTKISLGSLLLACQRFWPLGGPRTTITGCVQRFGDSVRIVGRIESSGDAQTYSLTRSCKTDDEVLSMVHDLAFKIAKGLEDPKHPIGAKTSEGLESFIDALEAYSQFALTRNTLDLDTAKKHSLDAYDHEADYSDLFTLLTDIGIAYAENKDYRSAAEIFQKAVVLAPTNATAHNNLGLMFGRLQRIEEARESFNKARLLSKDQPDVEETYYTNLGDAQSDAAHLDDAAHSYIDALQHNKNSTAALLGLARVYIAKADYNQARNHLAKALQIEPHGIKQHLLLGDLLQMVSDYDGARAEYALALKVDSQNSEALNGLGKICLELGDNDAAKTSFEQAIDSTDNYSAPHIGLGSALRAKGDLDGAIREYQHAAELDPLNEDPHIVLGEMYLDREEFDAAEKELRKGIELAPKSASGHTDLGNLLLNQGKMDEARQEFDLAEQSLTAGGKELLQLQGDWCLANHEYEQARAKYDAAIELAPNNPWSRLKLGDLYRTLGKLDLAKEQYNAAAKQAPNLADALQRLAYNSFSTGAYKSAVEEYAHAIQKAPGWCEPHLGLGDVYYELGDLDTAMAEYYRGIGIARCSSDGHADLADVFWRTGKDDKALVEYEQAVKFNARNVYAQARLATLLLVKGKNQQANVHSDTAYKIEPDNYTVGFVAGLNAALRGKAEQANAVWNKTLSIAPCRTVADKLHRFMILCALTRVPDARQLLQTEILSLPMPPLGLLKEKHELANSKALRRTNRFRICAEDLASAMIAMSSATANKGPETGKTGGLLKPASVPAKSLPR